MAKNRPYQHVRDENDILRAEFVHTIQAVLTPDEAKQPQNKGQLKNLVLGLHESDLADLIEQLTPKERQTLIDMLGQDFDSQALSQLDETVRDDIVHSLPNEQVAQLVQNLESDDAVYVLENLEQTEQADILQKIPPIERATLTRSLEFPENSAGRLMQADFVAVPPFWSVGQTIDHLRETDNLPTDFSEIFVVSPTFHLTGTVQLSRILRAKRTTLIKEIMDTERQMIPAHTDQEEVARLFERYNLLSAPVINENRRLMGVITIDDVVDVIQQEAEKDIHRLGGVGDESLANSVLRTTQSRFTWLLVNLLTAILASMVISLFDATLQQIIALAILMPIVASMGGNAGTQTMTVAVRALAMKELGAVNARRIITREMLVGLLNGILFALLMGAVAWFWFGQLELAMVLSLAMIINLLVAGLSGILIPMMLDRLKIDPAIASSVFVTTVTDVVGFFAFLGLAAIML